MEHTFYGFCYFLLKNSAICKFYSAVLMVPSLQANSSSCNCQTFRRCATDSAPVIGGRRGIEDSRHPSLCRPDTYSTSVRFDLPYPPAADSNGGGSVGAKLAALLSVAVLVCLNIHTFWSRDLRSLTMSLRNETRVFRVCDIPASTGWYFQRVWPRVEQLFSQLAPDVLLLSLALYGLCALHFATNKTNVRPLPNLIVTQDNAAPVVSVASRRRQMVSTRCRAVVERREHLRVVLLLALVTSVASLLNGATHFVAALNPTSSELSTREWLLVLLISHSLHLLIECVTLPLCLVLSARFRSHFCSLLFFCVRRHYAIQQCKFVLPSSAGRKSAMSLVPCEGCEERRISLTAIGVS